MPISFPLLSQLLPELLVVFAAVSVLIGGAFLPTRQTTFHNIALGVLVLAGVVLARQPLQPERSLSEGEAASAVEENASLASNSLPTQATGHKLSTENVPFSHAINEVSTFGNGLADDAICDDSTSDDGSFDDASSASPLAVTLVATSGQPAMATTAPSSGPLKLDPFSRSVRWLALCGGGLLVIGSRRQTASVIASEQLSLLLMMIAGTMLAGIAGDVVLLVVALELVSFPTYVLVYCGNCARPSQEAAVKYFYLSIVSSALLLFGVSMLYGVTGSISLTPTGGEGVRIPALAGGWIEPSRIAIVLLVFGLAFKLAAAPAHFYAPDVYQDSSNATAGILAVMPKFVGLIALIRILGAVVHLPDVAQFAWQLLMVLAVVSMTLGNVCALWQKNLRRLMAYSSIAHAGYLLIGVAVACAALASGHQAAVDGLGAALFYLLVYWLATYGIFALLAHLSDDEEEVSGVEALRGLGRSAPLPALLLAICCFSLAGIPPLAGFWGKLSLLASALGTAGSTETGHVVQPGWLLALAIITVLNAAIGAAYYLRIISLIYFHPPSTATDEPKKFSWTDGPLVSGTVCGLLVVLIGLVSGPLMTSLGRSAADAWQHGAPRRSISSPTTTAPASPSTSSTASSSSASSATAAHAPEAAQLAAPAPRAIRSL